MAKENLENRVGEITLALSEKGIKANVLVKNDDSILKKKQQFYIVANGVSESEHKRICVDIHEVILTMAGYGTSSANYKDGTLEIRYTPVREEEPKKDSTYRAAGSEKK